MKHAAGGPDITRLLEDFLHFAAEVADLVVRDGRETFVTDRRNQLTAEALIHKLGEIAARLPDAFIAQHPTVAWRALKGMRKVVAHEYAQIDYDLMWVALAARLPADAAEIRRILGRLSR